MEEVKSQNLSKINSYFTKEAIKDSKKIISKKQETLNLVNEDIDGNSNGTLILDTLATDDTSKIKEKKYIPPKTTKNLAPSVRKIVKESNIDIAKIEELPLITFFNFETALSKFSPFFIS